MFLRDFFNIGSLDLEFIEDYYAVIKDYMDFADLNDLELRRIDANAILNEIFYYINTEVFSRVIKSCANLSRELQKKQRKIIKICEQRMDEFIPYLNCLDSSFQNELDAVTIKGKNIEEISDNVLQVLLKNIENN